MPLPALRNYPYLDIMGEMGYAFWPIPWLSPRHALVLVSLPMLALLQGLFAAALMSCLLQNTTVRAAAPAWRPLVLTTLMPSAVLFFAIRWAGLPLASAAIDQAIWPVWACLLYTSDAADDLLCVDLGGRRIIKKKTPNIHLIFTVLKLTHTKQLITLNTIP